MLGSLLAILIVLHVLSIIQKQLHNLKTKGIALSIKNELEKISENQISLKEVTDALQEMYMEELGEVKVQVTGVRKDITRLLEKGLIDPKDIQEFNKGMGESFKGGDTG